MAVPTPGSEDLLFMSDFRVPFDNTDPADGHWKYQKSQWLFLYTFGRSGGSSGLLY
jgi:hypothetical protein